MLTLYRLLKPRALKHLKHYRDDFLIHDRSTLSRAMPGETYIWMVRESGTHLHLINGVDADPAVIKRSWDWIDAERDLDIKSVYVVECLGKRGQGMVTKMDRIPTRPQYQYLAA